MFSTNIPVVVRFQSTISYTHGCCPFMNWNFSILQSWVLYKTKSPQIATHIYLFFKKSFCKAYWHICFICKYDIGSIMGSIWQILFHFYHVYIFSINGVYLAIYIYISCNILPYQCSRCWTLSTAILNMLKTRKIQEIFLLWIPNVKGKNKLQFSKVCSLLRFL